MRRTLQQAGISPDDLRKHIEQQSAGDPKLAGRQKLLRERMDRNPVYSSRAIDMMVAAGLKRLAEFQHADGSWGWWKDDSGDLYMTAYVVTGLALAQECDVKLPKGMVQRGRDWLVGQVSQGKAARGDWSRVIALIALAAMLVSLHPRIIAAVLRRYYHWRKPPTPRRR
jgi:uncharacterized protein YfaS (alpha-2-macroglobulin family)